MLSAPIQLSEVRRLFATPSRLQDSSFLRREVAERMAEKLDLIRIDAKRVLDAGCGDGADLLRLVERFPQVQQVLGIDASWQALQQSGFASGNSASVLRGLFDRFFSDQHKQVRNTRLALVCGDFAQLPLQSNVIDVLWSNLALHWHPQPDQVLQEWFRVLARNGIVMFSSFGPDTLLELKQCFAQLDDDPHTLPFVDMHDFGDMLVAAGFATPVMDVERITLRYQDVRRLLADVKALGGNPLANRRRGLWGKNGYARLQAELEKKRDIDGRIPLTIEVVFGHAFKPVPTKLASGESIIRFDMKKNK
jgi:malonyl-CoA O-methyltransferase